MHTAGKTNSSGLEAMVKKSPFEARVIWSLPTPTADNSVPMVSSTSLQTMSQLRRLVVRLWRPNGSHHTCVATPLRWNCS
jgi:hypothetical protein